MRSHRGGHHDHPHHDHEHRDGDRGGDRGGRHRGERLFGHGDLRLLILHLIAEKPRHGYDIIKEIEGQTFNLYSPSPGVVYPTLVLLEELGFVATTTTESAKKMHTITVQGEAHLVTYRPTVDALLLRLSERKRASAAEVPSVIAAAIENLTVVVRARVVTGNLTSEDVASIASAIDQATTVATTVK